jgi:hypothetical protein
MRRLRRLAFVTLAQLLAATPVGRAVLLSEFLKGIEFGRLSAFAEEGKVLVDVAKLERLEQLIAELAEQAGADELD